MTQPTADLHIGSAVSLCPRQRAPAIRQLFVCIQYFLELGIEYLFAWFTEEGSPTATAVVFITIPACTQADAHTINLDLSVGHTRLRTSQTAVGPGDRFDCDQADLIDADFQPLGEILFRLQDELLHSRIQRRRNWNAAHGAFVFFDSRLRLRKRHDSQGLRRCF